MKKFYVILSASALLLSACGLVDVEYDTPPASTDSAEAIIEDVPVRETKNVAYTGVVAPAGISVYNQGTHRLILPGGKFVLLEAEDIDLNGYVDEEVQIFGALRPTVEAGGMIMRVERIELISEDSEDAELIEEEVTEDSEDSELIEEEVTEDAEDAEANPVDEPADEPEDEAPSADLVERIEMMARQDFSESNWTQQYCTSHISFCSPVHRNWWFKSFGATSSTLWHVELSPEPIESLGQGPIVIELIAGAIGEADGTIDNVDGQSIGYKEWTFGRHFRISGDASLEQAILYITQNITDYAG